MVKMLTWRFHKSLGFFKMLIVKGRSETRLLREWLNQVFDSLKFWEYISYDDYVFFRKV